MATLAHTPPAKKADKGLAAQFKRTAASHMKEIAQKTQDNVELQLLVIDTIRKYEGDLACSSWGYTRRGHQSPPPDEQRRQAGERRQ